MGIKEVAKAVAEEVGEEFAALAHDESVRQEWRWDVDEAAMVNKLDPDELWSEVLRLACDAWVGGEK